jgi:hypothetical protein
LSLETFEWLSQHINRSSCRGLASSARPCPQLWGNFRYNVSTFDLLLTCGPKARDIILAGTP